MKTLEIRKDYPLDNFLLAMPNRINIFVEIGSYGGESMQSFWDTGKIEFAYCVDPWENGWASEDPADRKVDMADIEVLFDQKHSANDHIFKLKMTSENACFHFRGSIIDMVYIDANHLYEFVKEDILRWLPKIVSGGIISGHDYGFSPCPGVKKAVDEIFGMDKVERFNDLSWMVRL